MRRLIAPIMVTALFLAVTACGGGTPSATPPASTDPVGPSAAVGTVAATANNSATASTAQTTAGNGGSNGPWPSPEDCISYDPNTVKATYAAGVWAVKAGSAELVRVYGGPSDTNGKEAEALAKRYKKVCFIGRSGHRDEKERYIFEYWRDASGISTSLPDPEDACSSYNKNNIQVDDMGSDGWRVKDHDHVLQEFDTQQDANNGKIVLAKYGRVCTVRSETPSGTPADITYA